MKEGLFLVSTLTPLVSVLGLAVPHSLIIAGFLLGEF